MGLLDGFLTPDATGYQDRQTNRRLAVKADDRAERALRIQEEDARRGETQRSYNDIFNLAYRENYIDRSDPAKVTGQLTNKLAQNDEIAKQYAFNMLEQRGVFGEGVKADQITYNNDTQFFSLKTKNAQGEDGAATYDGKSNDDSEIIQVPLSDINGMLNLFHRTTVLSNLGTDKEAAIAQMGATGAYVARELAVLDTLKGADQEAFRDAVSLLSKSGEPDVSAEEREEALELAEEMARQASSRIADPVGPEQTYEGPVTRDELIKLGITKEEWAGLSNGEKEQVLETLNNRRFVSRDVAGTAKGVGAYFQDKVEGLGDLATDVVERARTSDIGKSLGLAAPLEKFEPTEKDTNLRRVEAEQAAKPAVTMDDLNKSFSEIETGFVDKDSDTKAKMTAQQKQLDRLEKIAETQELTPKQKARMDAIKDNLKAGSMQNSNTEANEFLIENSSDELPSPASEAAPDYRKVVAGKSVEEINTMIADGSLKISQAEAKSLAEKLESEGIKTIDDIYKAKTSKLDKILSLSVLRMFAPSDAQAQNITKAMRNIEDGGTLTQTPNEITDNRIAAANSQTTASSNRRGWLEFERNLRNDSKTEASATTTGISKIVSDVTAYMYGDDNELASDSRSVKRLLQQDIRRLNRLSLDANSAQDAEKYRIAKSELLSLALQAMGKSGEGVGFIETLSSVFNEGFSGSPRGDLNNITSDGTYIFYQEPNSSGRLEKVGNGISIAELMKIDSEMTEAILEKVRGNSSNG